MASLQALRLVATARVAFEAGIYMDMTDPLYALAREVFDLDDGFPLSDQLGVGAVPGWDSLGTMKLALAVEERFGIQLELEEIAELGTLGDLRRTLAQRSTAS